MRAAEPDVHSIPIAVVTPANLGEHVRLRARDIAAAVLRRLAPSSRDSAWVNALPNSRSQTEPTPGAITPDPPTTPVAPQLIAYAARPRLAPTRTIARALIVQQILCLYNFPERADVAPERSSSDRGQIPIPAAWEIKGNPVRSRLRPKFLIFLRAEVFNTSAMY